jgi:preprotein translocase subunit SecA
MYPKLSGMTGTALTEAPEFFDIYKMNVGLHPDQRGGAAHRRGRRVLQEHHRQVRRHRQGNPRPQEKGQPVLVGTVSIEKSEMLSEFSEGGDQALGAERPLPRERGAYRRPGRPLGAVTIATNMAGRGTDIQLGGNLDSACRTSSPTWSRDARIEAQAEKIGRDRREKQRVLDVGGLFVLGTERHESRRIDNQLRGRSGRQGDPGLSRFYLSLDDDLLRIFGPQTMFAELMNKNLADGEAIVSPMDLQGDRDRAEEGRGAQLRHPQAGRRI